MATAEQIRAQIAEAEGLVATRGQEFEESEQAIRDAEERQQLRRQLEAVEDRINEFNGLIEYNRVLVDEIDTDREDIEINDVKPFVKPREPNCALAQGDIRKTVHKGEEEWTITGMSWVIEALKQAGQESIWGRLFEVGGHRFRLCYNPSRGHIGLPSSGRSGTLLVESCTQSGLTFRHSWFIKRGQEFVQWGKTLTSCEHSENTAGRIYGPDVTMNLGDTMVTAPGIFGLDHTELCASEWCQNDEMTVKCKLEVRTPEKTEPTPAITVPSPTITSEMRALFESGNHTDVTFCFNGGEQIQAHSLILMARSEVFSKQLSGSMKDAGDKSITIEDADPGCFQTFLQFLYTDDLSSVEELSKGLDADSKIALLQGVMAVSHKYQVQRLQSFCEQQLGALLSLSTVCGVICQAHLYLAYQLEAVCLDFICSNLESIVCSQEYGVLTKEWPAVILKIQLHSKGIASHKAKAAFEAQEGTCGGSKKRKR